ncbi:MULTISPECIES: VirB10/TraB/TrbI family type IV secretion system protein [Enterobacteriaceae]|uniref:VirB10/TraB/TrbI family type IV secretion system protein n=1 Tax=Enterobacteriaceae TaxID=543 RepID=UPI000F87F8F7|nr:MULTISPECIES: VirB10/TraB/TrbI family type IV secretion system protein [Enterobacteriaceae]MCC2035812.1 TrbI/VirB10 family protein [Raoultella ornithinolytica]MCC2043435.1 TrbI/VirB10 family protein [Raoultella ornithinolytica]MCC2048228.1 TrbI/VirB10 family protein [Raoultella ornithinolytica]MCC2050153.1 TrbI/VirB10 family protein [Raoultella ornithinolytica]MCC2056985.1 TrbI/VirB10 family protein [Raoultella ornithinolytica]
MTDKPVPDEPEKTTAEREAEARERARATMAYQEPEQRTSPGQPEVTRFRKASGRRTLIVSLLSLALVIALASGGDRLFSALKGGNEKEAGTVPPPSAEKTLQERQNLGMDSNPFGLFGPHTQDGTDPVSQTVTPAPTLPSAPPALNKAAALADGPNNTRTMPGDNARTSPDEPRSNAETSDSRSSSTTYTSCPSVLARGKDGRLRCPETAAPETDNNDNPGVARVTGVRRLGLDPDFYIPVDRYIPCSMMWRFVSDVGGPISCLISEDVYSASNHVTLIPAGTVARGIYRTGALQHGRSRMFVLWTELRTPEPGSLQIPLTDTQASGPLGEAGISGWIDNHFWERFGNALMLSTVQDVAAAVSDAAPGKDRNTDYTENTRAATAEMAKTTLDNSINIPPTLYLNQGDVIGIMTGTDIDFSSVWQLRLKKRWYER